MVIDVMDLNINKLLFNRPYDSRRLRRGRDLYERQNVTIKLVDKIGENEYNVEANVEGSNSFTYYRTKLKIKENKIIDCSCTCEDFRSGYTCKHIIATALETVDPNSPSTDRGRKLQEEKRKKEMEEIKRRQAEELKRLQYNRKYSTGLNLLSMYEQDNNTKIQNLNIPDLYLKASTEKLKKPSELATSVKITCTSELETKNSLNVSFKIGESRMYALNISDFYKAYKEQSELYIGKKLSLIPKKENFEDSSKDMFDFIIKYGEIVDFYNRNSRYGTNFNRKINVSDNNIDEFMHIMKQNGNMIIKSYMDGESDYTFTDEKLNIYCVFDREDVEFFEYSWRSYEDSRYSKSKEYVLKLNLEDYGILYSSKNVYFFYQNKIYTLEKEKWLMDILNLFSREERIIVPKDKVDEFKNVVFPKLRFVKDETIKKLEEASTYIVNKVAAKMLLDVDNDGNILLTLKFCYGDNECNILDKNYNNFIKENNIIRDIPSETKILERLFLDGFEYVKDRKEFIMKNTDDIYNFITNKIEGYMNDFEVLATDKFKNKQIKRPKISSVGIKIDNGLLELDLSKINIDIKEIKDILKDYNIKKKYHKLKNGDLLDLSNNSDLALLDEMSTTLDIDYSKIDKGVVNLPISRSFYLEKLIESNKDINVSKNEEFSKIIDSVENSDSQDDIELDKNFEDKLRDYQKIGYKWLKTLEKYKFGGILADDMGLGKTLQIIALLQSSKKDKKKSTSIVVCPSTLVLNWKSEVEKWCDSMKLLIVRGNAEERARQLENYKDFDLVITSYDLLKRDIDNYNDKYFKYIIADEAQYIKNSTTQNATSLKNLKGEIKFALTGTPIENSVAELWSIFDFIMPGYLYNYNKFKKKFEEPILKNQDVEALSRLKKLIAPFVLRRVKKDVLTELPEKNITIMKNQMEDEQQKIYLSYLMQTRKEIAEELSDSTFEKSKFKILMLLTRLRQICCHPGLFIDNYKGGSGKLKQCMDLINDAIEANHKILLFSSYTSMFDIIEKELDKQKIKYFKLVGSTPVSNRIEMVEEFNKNKDIKVFLISLKAGGTGLNLTSADVVIHYDPWWNVSSENQATDRAYRIGQKNSVQVYKLITSDSIEEKINKMQEKKEKLSKDILSTKETFINKMSKDEILDLFA